MDTNDLTCTCVFDFIAFTCRLNWMNYVLNFLFLYSFTLFFYLHKQFYFSYKLKPMTIKYKNGTSQRKDTSSVSTQTPIGFIGKNKELSAQIYCSLYSIRSKLQSCSIINMYIYINLE